MAAALRSSALALAAILTACATTPKASPGIEVRTVTVDRPIPVPCIRVEDVPATPPKVGNLLNGDVRHDSEVLAAANLRLRKAFAEALAIIGACTK